MAVNCKLLNNKLDITYDGEFEHRSRYTKKLAELCVEKYNINYDFEFTVHTHDHESPEPNAYSFCTINKKYDECFPSFMFMGWPSSGCEDYEKTRTSFTTTQPLSEHIGWRGITSSNVRQSFLDLFKHNKNIFDIDVIHWAEKSPHFPFAMSDTGYKKTKNLLSYQDMINKWKYLIDIEGNGFSGRLPMLLNTCRIVFIVDRPWHEFWYDKLEPWVNHIPVKRDLSDLEENYHRIQNDLRLQNFIRHQQKQLANTYLTRDYALKHIKSIIERNKI
mgnify:FL=1